MTPTDIHNHFKPVFDQARALKDAFKKREKSEQEAAAAASQLNLPGGKKKTSMTSFVGSLVSVVPSIHSQISHSPSPSSDSLSSLASVSSHGAAAFPLAGAGISPLAACPPTSSRTIPFVTVSTMWCLCILHVM